MAIPNCYVKDVEASDVQRCRLAVKVPELVNTPKIEIVSCSQRGSDEASRCNFDNWARWERLEVFDEAWLGCTLRNLLEELVVIMI